MSARLRCLACAGLVIGAAATAAGGLHAQEPPRWVEETPGGDTGCAFDTPYRFFHAGLEEAADVLVWFQGGGACWSWVSCSGMFDTDVSGAEMADYRGIFDRDNPSNPFREYGVIVAPYCTGDVHVGDAVVRYGNDPSARPVHHRGSRNALAVLEFVERRVSDAGRVVVSGASAGAYGAIFWAPEIVRRFPGSDIVVLGDSGIPLLNDYADVLRGWGAEAVLAEIRDPGGAAPADLSLVEAHVGAAAGGAARVAQLTSDRDAIQSAFYMISGSPEWRPRTYALLDSVAARLPAFRSYVVAGPDHGLMRTDRFYEYESDGVRLRDWVADLIEGRPVDSIRCEACRIP